MLHIVDSGTSFSTESFLSGKSTKEILKTFAILWANMCTGYPVQICIDQDFSFNSTERAPLYSDASTQSNTTGTEFHN